MLQAKDLAVSTEPVIKNAETIWLFSYNGLRTVGVPCTLFAVGMAVFGQFHQSGTIYTPLTLSTRFLETFFWVWINLLPLAIHNQRQDNTIKRDRKTNPWKPIPSGRLNKESAQKLAYVFHAAAILTSTILGGRAQCLALIILGYWYVELEASETYCNVRKFIKAAGYICFASGASEVMAGQTWILFHTVGRGPLMVLVALVLTAVQAQRMAEQVIERNEEVKPQPLVVREPAARYTVLGALAFWTVFKPSFWHTDLRGLALPLILTLIVARKFLLERNQTEGKSAFQVYSSQTMNLLFAFFEPSNYSHVPATPTKKKIHFSDEVK